MTREQAMLNRLVEARRVVGKIVDNMTRQGSPMFKPMIARGKMLTMDLDAQINNIRGMQAQQGGAELGFAFLIPLAWPLAVTAGSIALAAATKFVTDSWTETKKVDTYQTLVDRYGPQQAARMAAAQQETSTTLLVKNITYLAGIVIGGILLLKVIKA